MTIYSTGYRLMEATHLKATDIDSERMQVRINQGKGKKDRYTILSKTCAWHEVLAELLIEREEKK